MANKNETFEQTLSALTSRFLYGKPKSLFPQEVKSLTDNILAAHKRETDAKDVRIARLNERLTACANDMLQLDDEIEKRDALIEELVDALEKTIECMDDCSHITCSEKPNCVSLKNRALVAKAREAIK